MINQEALNEDTTDYLIPFRMSDSAWYDLSLQKQTLLRAIEKADPEDSEKLTGILHMIDSIQDDVVREHPELEVIVFPGASEEAL